MSLEQANKMSDILRGMMPPEERRASILAMQARLIARLGELQEELAKIPKTAAATPTDKEPPHSIEQRLSALERQRQGHVYGHFPGPLIAQGFFLPK